jgi:hypothetical protein
MNKTIIALISGLFLITPSFADQPADLDRVPKDVLEQGLNATAVCATIDLYGMKRLMAFYDDNKGDTTAAGSIADKAVRGATDLYDDLQVENLVLSEILKSLRKKFAMTDDAITATLTEIMTAAKEGLETKYDSIDGIDAFIASYKVSTDACDKAFNAFVVQAKKQQGLDVQNHDTHI